MINGKLEIRITWADIFKEFTMGIIIVLTLTAVVVAICKFVLRQSLIINIIALLLVLLIGGMYLIFLFSVAGTFSFAMLATAIVDLNIMLTYKGILYKMDEQGFTYYEEGKLCKKQWLEIVDIGCYRQYNKKQSVIYKYQVKFTDNSVHVLDLRGRIRTEVFKEKFEDYWLTYVEKDRVDTP